MPKHPGLFIIAILLLYCETASGQVCNDSIIAAHLSNFWKTFQIDRGIDENDQVLHKTFRKFTIQNKEVIFLGTRHRISDTTHFMYTLIDSIAAEFRPDAILSENYQPVFAKRNDAIKYGNDVGYVVFLANQGGIFNKSWDNIASPYNQVAREFGSDPALLMVCTALGHFDNSTPFNEYNYLDYLNRLMQIGFAITPAQTKYSYYVKIFENFFSVPFLAATDSILQLPSTAITENKLRKKIFIRFNQLRDIHLLESLKETLKKYNRVLIQGGFAHLNSTKDILPCFLNRPNGKRQPDKRRLQLAIKCKPTPKNATIILESNPKYQLCLYPFQNSRDSLDSLKKDILDYINKLHPDLILTEQSTSIFATEGETIALSGLSAYIRYLAINKKIALEQWWPSWNDIYYQVLKSYSPLDIYITLISNKLLKSISQPSAYNNFPVLFQNMILNSVTSGYPFKHYEFELSYFINHLTHPSHPGTSYSIPELQQLLKKNINQKLAAEIDKLAISSFLDSLEKYRSAGYRKMLIFMDTTLMPHVYNYVTEHKSIEITHF